MQTFEEVLTHFHSFLESATYLDAVSYTHPTLPTILRV